ncbi:MAG: hypothetical protein HY873_05165 [Chloroflexi bacterium]|nr:hypothetical protein [Chloroflexota bacterium]
MSIEKAFAMHASPSDIYSALQRDIASASAHEGDVFQVLERERDRMIQLHVAIGGVPCYLTYRIDEKPEHVEVTATLVPHGWRYVLFQLATLGPRRHALEMVIVQGLSNLKQEVEGSEDASELTGDYVEAIGESDSPPPR